jgi:hypothetical protein
MFPNAGTSYISSNSMKYTPISAALAVLILLTPSQANEHLEPEYSQFARAGLPPNATSLRPYHEIVITVLEGAFDADVRARLIAMPSYTPEYAVGIRETNDRHKIFHLASQSQLWSYENLKTLRAIAEAGGLPGQDTNIAEAIAEYEARLPGDYHDVETNYCEIDIASELAEDLLVVWERILLETRYGDQEPVGPDGTDYHFSMSASGVIMAGKVWSPNPQSKTGAMVSITETMKNLCLTADQNLLAQLEPQVSAMREEFGP